MPKLIPLTKGQFATVDDEDYEWLSQYKWQARWSESSNAYYASMLVPHPDKPGKWKLKSMHGMITKAKMTDHIDRNTLNNTRSNLRPCNTSQNNANHPVRKDNKLGVKGVALHKKKYVAVIRVYGKRMYLGVYPTIEEAKAVYDAAALKYYGEFARSA